MVTGLLFSGQGAQQIGMGRTLYESSETARSLYDQANEVLGWDLKGICFEGPEADLRSTKVCQPALYVHGYVVFRLLQEQGHLNQLKAACGLSLGELTALASAGVFDFETGLRLVAERGRLMQSACDTTKGGMASVIGGTPEAVQALCDAFDAELAARKMPLLSTRAFVSCFRWRSSCVRPKRRVPFHSGPARSDDARQPLL